VKKDERVNERKYTYQTQAACPILYPLSDLGEHWRRSGYRFEPSSSVWRFNQWLACCTGFPLWHGHSAVSSAPLVDGSTGVVNLAGVESDEPQEHMGVIGLTLFGACVFIGALGEPITYELLNPSTFNPLLAVIQAGMIIIPFVMMVFAIQEWRRRRLETKQKESRLIGNCVGEVSGGQDRS
jgi:hypothetical protein